MKRHIKFTFTAIALAGAAGVAIAATAAGGAEPEAAAATAANVPLSQAVLNAENHVHGKATHAAIRKLPSGWAYAVEVVGAQKSYDVHVDATSGAVISAKEDAHDDEHEDDASEQDDDND